MNNFNEKYNERQLISRGQWADTYKSVNSITKDIVVLKVLVNDKFNEEYIDRLQEEVRAIKEMESPNLININTMGSIIGNGATHYYIEAENFSGVSLKEKLQDGKLSGVEAVKILRQVAEGLKEFHFKSISYNELSCENIYVDEKGRVKLDTLAYLEGKYLSSSSTEEFGGEEDIFSLGSILYELVTGSSDFKPGKSKISDKNLLHIINKCTNTKYNMYEDLNGFVADCNAYLEYGGESENVVKEEPEVFVEENEEDVEVELKQNPYKVTPLQIVRNLGACVIVFLMVATTINGGSLFNKENTNKEESIAKVPTVTEPKVETPAEEEEAVEPEVEEETMDEPVVSSVSNDDTTYNQPTSTDNNNYNNSNNTSNNYYPNYNNTNNSTNNNTGNNTNNSTNNNTGNNTNNGGSQYPSQDSTDTPSDNDTNSGGSVPEETPTPEPTPTPTPDTTPEGDSNIEIESEIE